MAAAVVCGVAALLSVAYGFTRAPWWDEGLYADVARQFARHGTLGSPLLGATGSFGFADLPRANVRTYWTTPLYPVVVGAWFRLVGEGLVQMRVLSVLITGLLVSAWVDVVRRLTRSAAVAVVAAALIAANAHVLWSASIGRPEALASALAAVGAALYLRWREARLLRAVCAAAALVTAGALAHPLAAVEGGALAGLILALDARRLRPRHVLGAAVAAGLVLSPWVLYVAQDFGTFRAQWTGNTRVRGGSRLDGLAHPLRALAYDLRGRYLQHNYTGAQGAARFLALELAAGAACVAFAFASPAVRRRPGFGPLAGLALGGAALLAVLDPTQYRQYMVHAYPALVAFAALAVCELARRRGAPRAVAAALATCLTLPGLGCVASSVIEAPYRRDFLPVAKVIQQRVRAGARVVAGSEFTFAVSPDTAFADDMDMRAPADLYVQSEWYHWFTTDRPVREQLAREYQVVYTGGRYTLFARRPAPLVKATERTDAAGAGRPVPAAQAPRS